MMINKLMNNPNRFLRSMYITHAFIELHYMQLNWKIIMGYNNDDDNDEAKVFCPIC